MKKRILSLLITLLLLLSLTPALPAAAASGKCGANLTWVLDGSGTLTISGSGDMWNWIYGQDYGGSPWYFNQDITNIVINNGVTSIGNCAFMNCYGVTSVKMADSVRRMGNHAFSGCEKLSNVHLSNNLQSIDDDAFAATSNLKNIQIPGGVSRIGKSAFHSSGLTSISIPGSVTSIDEAAFINSRNMTSITLSNRLTAISRYTFRHCTSLKSISIPGSVTKIDEWAFSGSGLTSISIPYTLKSVGYHAFSSCSNLKKVYYNGTGYLWNKIRIGAENTPLTSASLQLTFYTASLSLPKVMVGDKKRAELTIKPMLPSGTAVTWSSSNNAVATVDANGYVTGKSPGTATITARAGNGVMAGCTITVAPLQSKLDYSNFMYDFINEGPSFGYPKSYKIPAERYLQAGFSVNLSQNWSQEITRWTKLTWGGNCFGMSTSSILFYKDVLKEEKYESNVTRPRKFTKPADTDNRKLRDMIELMQVSQFRDDCVQPIFSANVIAKELQKGNPVKLGLKNAKGEGHAVIIYGYTKTADAYIFDIYDCSGFVTSLVYTDETHWHFNYSNPYYLWKPNNYCTFDTLKNMHRSMYNDNRNGAISLLSANSEPQRTYLIRPMENTITITNSAGQTAQIIAGDVTGDIENLSVIPDSYLAENPSYTIIAPKDTYTISGASDEMVTTVIANDFMGTTVSSVSSAPLTLSADLHEISVQNPEPADYLVKYITFDNTFDEMTLSGTTDGTICTSLNQSDIAVTGANSIAVQATVSEQTVSVSSEDLPMDHAVVTVKNAETTSVQILADNQALTAAEALPSREQAATPGYDLAGGVYNQAQTLTFTKDDNTLVYYTTDGSIPDENSFLYTMPISINKSMTITAIAKKYGYTDSEPVVLSYTLPEVPSPVSNISSGTYDTIQSVALDCDENSRIYYTTDESDPIDNGIAYTCEINITTDTILKAIAIKDGCVSDVVEYAYAIQHKYPLAVINTPTDQNGDIITDDTIGSISAVRLVCQKFGAEPLAAEFVVTCYDENDCITGITFKKITCNDDTQVIELPVPACSATKTIKIFSWDSLCAMKPVSEPCIINQ